MCGVWVGGLVPWVAEVVWVDLNVLVSWVALVASIAYVVWIRWLFWLI